jgi:hypothetical protein
MMQAKPTDAIANRLALAGVSWYDTVWRKARMPISQELLEILVCPKCKGDIHLTPAGDGLVCDACRLMYPIRDDIPIMLIDEAIKLG